MESDWANRGYFDFSDFPRGKTPTQIIRGELCQALGLHDRDLGIAFWPVGPSWKHIVWWRKGERSHAEAQFLMEVAGEYPILSLGVSIEKGFVESADDRHRMDRSTWHWSVLLDAGHDILATDVPAIHARAGSPIAIRARVRRDGMLAEAESATFVYADGRWWKRCEGGVDAGVIVDKLREFDRLEQDWVDLHFVEDIPAEALENLTPKDVADRLLNFEPLWRRFHG